MYLQKICNFCLRKYYVLHGWIRVEVHRTVLTADVCCGHRISSTFKGNRRMGCKNSLISVVLRCPSQQNYSSTDELRSENRLDRLSKESISTVWWQWELEGQQTNCLSKGYTTGQCEADRGEGGTLILEPGSNARRVVAGLCPIQLQLTVPLERKYNYDGEAIKSQPGERSPFVVPTAAVFKWTHKKVEPTKTSFLLSLGSFFYI